MKSKLSAVLVLFFGFAAVSAANASPGLVIHSSEYGVGKFHRYDNQVHPYGASNSWKPYILPQGADLDLSKPLVTDNADGSVSIFFASLDQLVSSVIQVSAQRHQKVSVLNIHGHGLPGAMWFPGSSAIIHGWACESWVQAAEGSDETNYSQYYSAISPDEIRDIREMSNDTDSHMVCTTGLGEWRAAVANAPQFKSVFANDAQIHVLSCVVGLGVAGQEFTQGIADLLLPKNGAGRVETSTNFGLGDWSMPEGMGFWDLQTDEQVEYDNEIYVVDHTDREIAQKGTIRMVTYTGQKWASTLLSGRDFMSLGFESNIHGISTPEPMHLFSGSSPNRVRVPGTTVYVERQ
jgi:hypothetical protein